MGIYKCTNNSDRKSVWHITVRNDWIVAFGAHDETETRQYHKLKSSVIVRVDLLFFHFLHEFLSLIVFARCCLVWTWAQSLRLKSTPHIIPNQQIAIRVWRQFQPKPSHSWLNYRLVSLHLHCIGVRSIASARVTYWPRLSTMFNRKITTNIKSTPNII